MESIGLQTEPKKMLFQKVSELLAANPISLLVSLKHNFHSLTLNFPNGCASAFFDMQIFEKDFQFPKKHGAL